MEIRAILVAFVTIYCGMYYLTDELNAESKIILFIVMVIANLYFLIYLVSQNGRCWYEYCTGKGILLKKNNSSK